MNRRLFFVGACTLGLTLNVNASQDTNNLVIKPGQKLIFGLMLPRNADQMLSDWNLFFSRMSVNLGLKIELRAYTRQSELVRDFMQGNIDLAWLGNSQALNLIEAGKASIFASMEVNGKKSYKSILIVNGSSKIQQLSDIHRDGKNLIFGDGDLKSTSGHLVPDYYAFVKFGINNTESFFKEVKHGSHEDNLIAVARGQVDLATCNSSELDIFHSKYPEMAKSVRVIWESVDIPESPLIWKKELAPDMKKKINSFILNFGRKDKIEKQILWNINKITSFREASNFQLLRIADLEMFQERQKILNDSSLSEKDRSLKVDEIVKRASKLEMILRNPV